jgi:metal-responsive CopG/Arc/MetJ family transcriptional regulator
MQRKVMTSIKLQKKLHRQLQARIIEDGYGMRGKSKWIIESIESLLKIADYPELVEIAEDMNQLNDLVSIRLPEELMRKLDKAIIQVRKQYPTIEGVKSNLIRASIMQRLLREQASVTEV